MSEPAGCVSPDPVCSTARQYLPSARKLHVVSGADAELARHQQLAHLEVAEAGGPEQPARPVAVQARARVEASAGHALAHHLHVAASRPNHVAAVAFGSACGSAFGVDACMR